MPKTIYVSISDISDLQTNIMIFIQGWVHEKKKPTPLKEVILGMEDKGIKKDTTVKAIRVLILKGYIRRANTISNKTFFVQLRTV